MALGDILRKARMEHGETASQVAAATRMKVQIVEALEKEDFEKMAAPIYVKGFIKLYAEHVELDPAPLVDEYTQGIINTKRQAVGNLFDENHLDEQLIESTEPDFEENPHKEDPREAFEEIELPVEPLPSPEREEDDLFTSAARQQSFREEPVETTSFFDREEEIEDQQDPPRPKKTQVIENIKASCNTAWSSIRTHTVKTGASLADAVKNVAKKTTRRAPTSGNRPISPLVMVSIAAGLIIVLVFLISTLIALTARHENQNDAPTAQDSAPTEPLRVSVDPPAPYFD